MGTEKLLHLTYRVPILDSSTIDSNYQFLA